VKRVLLVEGSATLRMVLGKLLRRENHVLDIAHDYAAGLAKLQSGDDGAEYAAVVIGWPYYTDEAADELLALLAQGPLARLAVVVMAQEAEPAMRKWAAGRARTALVLWENYTEAGQSLAKLLAPTGNAYLTQTATVVVVENPIRVLFVDDSPTARVGYRRLLTREGYLVECASTVEEGFDLAQREPFDIAIVDYFMPESNGDALCRRLRDDPHTRHVVSMILTGTYSDDVIKESLDAGAVECTFKNEADALFLARVAAISRTVRVQKSVENERQRLEGILGSVGDGVYGVDTDGRISFVNPAARRILGFAEDEDVIGRTPQELFHYDDGAVNADAESNFLQRVYRDGSALTSWETTFWNRAGHEVPVECTVFPLNIEGRQEGAVVAFRDISERKTLEDKLRWQASHDPLTELFNRRYFEEQLDGEVQRLRRSNEIGALLYIDLDRFKYINDTAGHSAGDALLVEVARLLRTRLRDTDLLARLGGDEFAIIMRNVDPSSVTGAANAFLQMLNSSVFNCNGKEYKINASIGVALFSSRTQSPGEVLANADIACHAAKNKGRNCAHLFMPEDEQKTTMDYDLGWSTRLREAIERDGFVLHYQPIVPLAHVEAGAGCKDGGLWDVGAVRRRTPVCFEVLLRMRGRGHELIAPTAFLPTAERFNLMQAVDRWVIGRALSELGDLGSSGEHITLSVNLSAHSLGDRSLLAEIRRLLAAHHVAPERLLFEITETAAISNLDAARRFIFDLSRVGCRFALDDFGSGFSSFYHLKHLPVEFIKIDGAFVRGMAGDPIDRAMVVSMNDIAHSLGRQTIAEYVESAEILQQLKHCSVDFVQGECISRYFTMPEIRQWLEGNATTLARGSPAA